MLYRITLICPPDRVEIHYLNLTDMELIPIIERDGEYWIDSRDVAKELDIQHNNLIETINKHSEVIERDFGIIPFKTEELNGPGRPSRYAELSEDQALFIGTLSRNNEAVIKFKSKLVRSFQCMRKDMVNQRPLSPADLLLQSAQLLKDHDTRLREIEAKIQTKDESFYTISGFARLLSRPVPLSEARKLGKQATKLSEQLNYPIGHDYDPKYGRINTYHEFILNQIFEKWMNN